MGPAGAVGTAGRMWAAAPGRESSRARAGLPGKGRATAAARFNPLRRRVQHAVDRQFNRARYDADEAVAAFTGRLKDAVDLDSVRDDLTGVVQQTLEPAHLSVWVSRGG
jgi:hypothetical protein